MSDLTWTPGLVARTYNPSQLTASPEALRVVDTSKDKKIDSTELEKAIEEDKIVLSGNAVQVLSKCWRTG
jgi:hypothetical protein